MPRTRFQWPIPEGQRAVTRKGLLVKNPTYFARSVWGYVRGKGQSWNDDGTFIDRKNPSQWDLFLTGGNDNV